MTFSEILSDQGMNLPEQEGLELPYFSSAGSSSSLKRVSLFYSKVFKKYFFLVT